MPRIVRYFEDLTPGLTLEFGDTEVTAEAIIEFAQRYDPQPFHLDAEAARASIFGALCASGWHTAALTMRMLVDHVFAPESSLGSPGMDEIRWRRPVFAGDRLRCRFTIESATPSRSRPSMGSVRQRIEVLNQRDEIVMTQISIGLYQRRPA